MPAKRPFGPDVGLQWVNMVLTAKPPLLTQAQRLQVQALYME
jgi:hypothetical protein